MFVAYPRFVLLQICKGMKSQRLQTNEEHLDGVNATGENRYDLITVDMRKLCKENDNIHSIRLVQGLAYLDNLSCFALIRYHPLCERILYSSPCIGHFSM